MKKQIRIIPLGGIRESGENLYAVDVNDGIYILDCGLRYPNNEMLGIDLIIPDFTYLERNRDRIVGVFLTQSNAKALGGLPYFLSEFNVPVFGTKFTIAIAKHLVANYRKTRSFHQFNVINANSEIIFDKTTVTFFATTSSVPDSVGIVLNTKAGRIVYTGGFKFDQTVPKNYQSNLARFGQIGSQGVLALLSDSEHTENYHENVDENRVAQYLQDLMTASQSRIIVGCIANNLLRLQQIFDAAKVANRKVYLAHRQLMPNLKIAIQTGQLRIPKHLLVNARTLGQLKDSQVVILQAGKMGAPLKALQRMAGQQARHFNLKPNDLVIIATTPFHAMEVRVAETKDSIYRANGHVKMISDDLHVSNDASRNDLQLLLNLMNPKYLIPVQGEYRMLMAHAHLAEQCNLPRRRIIVPDKGGIITYNGSRMVKGPTVPSGDTIVDGSGVGDVGNIVLRDREVLSEQGIYVATVTIDPGHHRVVAEPKIDSRGFIYVRTNHDLIEKSAQIIKATVQDDLDHGNADWSYLKQGIRDALNSYLYKMTTHHPVIMPIIMETGQKHHARN